jgi:O-antigen/teichoic acid export membrane protein
VGAVIYWAFSQIYNYVLAGRVGITAVADVNAARLLLMPVIVLTIGIKAQLLPAAASWLATEGISRLVRRLLVFIAIIAVLDLCYFATVWLTRDWVVDDFLKKTIHDRDRLMLLWLCVALIGLTRDLLQCALLALERFKPLAWVTAAAAAVSLSSMWFAIDRWGPSGALIAQIAGESVSLVAVVWLLGRSLHGQSRSPRT